MLDVDHTHEGQQARQSMRYDTIARTCVSLSGKAARVAATLGHPAHGGAAEGVAAAAWAPARAAPGQQGQTCGPASAAAGGRLRRG
eukprot:9720649-Lingulodinium_polyedra.AAC.1